MAILHTQLNTRSPEFAANRAVMLEQVLNLRREVVPEQLYRDSRLGWKLSRQQLAVLLPGAALHLFGGHHQT